MFSLIMCEPDVTFPLWFSVRWPCSCGLMEFCVCHRYGSSLLLFLAQAMNQINYKETLISCIRMWSFSDYYCMAGVDINVANIL